LQIFWHKKIGTKAADKKFVKLSLGHSFEQTLGVAYVGGVCASRGKFIDSR
jgi:hypothetical protein